VGEDVKPRCRGKSGTQELLAWPLIASPPPDGLVLRTAAQATSCLPALDVRIRCIRKERGRWGFTTEETDGSGDWAENCRAVVCLKTEMLLRHQASKTGTWVEKVACPPKPA
jgi:hypothetical protein